MKEQLIRDSGSSTTSKLSMAKSAEWCPSLMKSSTCRILTGEEGDKVRQNIGFTDRERKMARSDLVDRSKEELSEFGKLISSRITHGEQSVVKRKEKATKGEVMKVREHGKRKLSMEERLDLAISKQFANFKF